MPTIRFNAKLFKIGSWTLLLFPKSASMKFPSRGMTMVKGTSNNFPFKTVLEPDGRGSHCFRVDKTVVEGANVVTGDTINTGV